MDHNQVPQPLFAPATQNGQNDDFDLNEVFADYFINEFDDPLNAYTGGMANYTGGVNVMAMAQQEPTFLPPAEAAAGTGPPKAALPTGGIRTAFHAGTAAPASKKVRTDDGVAPTPLSAMISQAAAAQDNMAQQQIGQAVAATQALGTAVGLQQQGQQQQQQPQQGHTATTAMLQGLNLPVGVGIRLGGIGGVAPATAQSRMNQGVMVPGAQYTQSTMWNLHGDQGDTEGMSEQAIAERRQRNREHAKRSRVRKKFMLESLQEEVRGLQRENGNLRMLIQQHIPEHAMQIISEICTENPLFGEGSDHNGSVTTNQPADSAGGDKTGALVRSDFSLMQSLASGQKCFVLSDPKLPDNPIVFATPDFYKLTGYTSKEVLGRNCRFLQGPGTDKRAIDVIRKSIASGSDATVCLLNYKADGTPFWNQFFIAALRDSDNNIVNFVGVQTEVEPEAVGASYLEDKVNAVLPLQTKED